MEYFVTACVFSYVEQTILKCYSIKLYRFVNMVFAETTVSASYIRLSLKYSVFSVMAYHTEDTVSCGYVNMLRLEYTFYDLIK